MHRFRPALTLVLLFCLAVPCLSQTNPSPGLGAPPKITEGPATVPLANNTGNLTLPPDFAFIGKEDTQRLLLAEGENPGEGTLGMVIDKTSENWYALLRYADVGYVKDDEADQLNGDNLLQIIKDNTNKANEERRQKGMSGNMKVVGWHIPPKYDRASHTLTWSIIGQEEGSPTQVINYTSCVFGRSGIMIDTVVGDYKDAAALQPKLAQISSSINFSQGQDYASFRPGDRISELTMTGLVTGGAAAAAYGAAKAGLLGKIGVFLLALKKGIVFIVIGLLAVIKAIYNKITGRSGDQPAKTTV